MKDFITSAIIFVLITIVLLKQKDIDEQKEVIHLQDETRQFGYELSDKEKKLLDARLPFMKERLQRRLDSLELLIDSIDQELLLQPTH